MIAHRPFETYDEYVYKQGGKARGNRPKLLKHLDRHIESYARLFRRSQKWLKPGPILCLGARTGAENLGAVQAGFLGSVGIDLHPVGESVQQGDWHALPFAASTFANVYSNSLDHCLSLEKLTAQVKHVLKPDGRFYVMATNRPKTLEAWQSEGGNEALYWQTSDDLRDAILRLGFSLVSAHRDGKWGHYIFTVTR